MLYFQNIRMRSVIFCAQVRTITLGFNYLCFMDYPCVNIHIHKRTGEGIELVSAMALAGVLPVPPCSLGIHPWQAGNIDIEAALKEVETASVAAIGEIGLDYAKPNDRGEQKMIFSAQLRIAEERGLPVILHCVKAFEPVMEVLQGFRLPAVIFHGFIGSPQQAARAVDSGYSLSFGPGITRSGKTVEAMHATPVGQMFLETDEFEMGIGDVYAGAARLLGTDIAALKKNIYENYIRIFGE